MLDRIVRLELHDLLEARHRFRSGAARHQRVAEPLVRGRGPRPELGCAPVACDRFVALSETFKDIAEGDPRAAVLRIELDDTLAGRERLVELSLQPQNAGKGSALRRGFQEVTGDLVVIQDADLEYSPEEFPELIELICEGRADVVYGSRFIGRHRVFLFTHYAGNRFLTLVTNVLYNTMLTDMETCYKVMRTEVLRSMTLDSDGFGIEPELTAKIFKRHYRVYEVPITYDGRNYDEGKKITWRDGFVALWVLLKYRFTE